MNEQIQHGNIDNDNGIANFQKGNPNVNDNGTMLSDNEKKPTNFERSKAVDLIAMDLVEKLKSPKSYPFYCKIAWRLQPSVIYNNLEMAAKGREPAKLFNYLCRKCLGEK